MKNKEIVDLSITSIIFSALAALCLIAGYIKIGLIISSSAAILSIIAIYKSLENIHKK